MTKDCRAIGTSKRCTTRVISTLLIFSGILAWAPATAEARKSARKEAEAAYQWGPLVAKPSLEIAIGTAWTADTPSPAFIFQGNADSIGYGSPGEFNPRGGRITDDGRLNFHDGGELGYLPLSVIGQLDLQYKNLTLELHGRYWYDYWINHHDVPFGHSTNGFRPNAPLDDNRREQLRDYFLQAYLYGDFKVDGHPLQLGIGSKLLKWGQSRFFINGINSIAPYDLGAVYMPRAPLRLRVPMIYAKYAASEQFRLEAFYQLAWRKTILNDCGEALSVHDFISDRCFGVPQGGISDLETFAFDLFIQRGPDRKADRWGQGGLALHYKPADENIELSLYAMQIHSRRPYVSIITDTFTTPGAGWRNPLADPGNAAHNAQYFADFPEKIRIFGASAKIKRGKATQIFGEYSYRPNQPVQLATADLVLGFARDPELIASIIGQLPTLGADAISAAPGSLYNGFDRLETSQISFGAIQPFPNLLGAKALILIGEAAIKVVHDLPSQEERRYNRTNVYGSDVASGNPIGCLLATAAKYRNIGCSPDGYTSSSAWGIRLRAQLKYPGILTGLNITPYIAAGHDVNGWSHDNDFVEGRWLGWVGIKAEYEKRYSAELFWAGSGNTDIVGADRDFISFSLGVKF